MYYYLHGMITMHTKDSVVIECSGVGYDVLVTHPSEFPIGESLFLFTCYFSHEDDAFLVGFKTMEEKSMFEALCSVKGIGPKTALGLLANTSTERLKQAIEESDQRFLTRLPNIGAKSASQIILDLKGKLDEASLLQTEKDDSVFSAVKEALRSLGFKEKEIQSALDRIEEKGLSVEQYTAIALRNLRK